MATRGTGFINWDELLTLNRPTADQMAQRVLADTKQRRAGVTGDLERMQAEFAASMGVGPERLSATSGWGDLSRRANDAEVYTGLAGRAGGRQELLRRQYGGATGFDAALAGAAGGNQFSQLQSQYGDLSRALGAADDASVPQFQQMKSAREEAEKARLAAEEEERRRRAAALSGRGRGLDTLAAQTRRQTYRAPAPISTPGRRGRGGF